MHRPFFTKKRLLDSVPVSETSRLFTQYADFFVIFFSSRVQRDAGHIRRRL